MENKCTDGTIIQFLNGSHSFQGVWFEQQHPDHKGEPFWWRKFLAATSPLQPEPQRSAEQIIKKYPSLKITEGGNVLYKESDVIAAMHEFRNAPTGEKNKDYAELQEWIVLVQGTVNRLNLLRRQHDLDNLGDDGEVVSQIKTLEQLLSKVPKTPYASDAAGSPEITGRGFMKLLDGVLADKMREKVLYGEDAKNIMNEMWELLESADAAGRASGGEEIVFNKSDWENFKLRLGNRNYQGLINMEDLAEIMGELENKKK